jgi:ABC-type lipoprotein export system ATPase subunit
MTIVLVTHEEDIAEYAARRILMRDGLVLDDRAQEPVAAQLPAADTQVAV